MRTRGAILSLAVVFAAACGSGGGDARGGAPPRRLAVVATTPVVADFTRAVGGEDVSVYEVVKANVDPHDFEPAPSDLEAIRKAAVIVQNGVGLEHWFDDVVRSAGPKGAVVDASVGVAVRKGAGGDDPHIWHDPRNAIRMVTTIKDALAQADPVHEADYRRRFEDYVTTLRSLDQEIEGQIGGLTNRKLVTNHDSLGYYVDRYGLEFVGSIIPSFDTSAELSAKDVNDLVARIRFAGVKAVFSESSLPPRTAETIGRQAGVKVVAGDDALYGDSLGPRGSPAATYVTMMRHNTRAIVGNLR